MTLRMMRCRFYLGKLNVRPLTTGLVTTMNEPVFVRATALMAALPNLAPRTFLQAVVEQLRGLMSLLALRAHFAT